MRLGIIGSRGIDKERTVSIIGDYIHSLETEHKTISSIVVSNEINGVTSGATEYAMRLSFKYSLESDENDFVLNNSSDALLVIWDGQTRGKAWFSIQQAVRRGIPLAIVVPERTRNVSLQKSN